MDKNKCVNCKTGKNSENEKEIEKNQSQFTVRDFAELTQLGSIVQATHDNGCITADGRCKKYQ